ncbi:MAG: CDP-alcohol phosphatidyltransferase family protein [Nitrososphaerota archaeon]|nr:CDP-alcohol phosphatidyltransferase family protein [Candidatus Calditenuis fumarioli]
MGKRETERMLLMKLAEPVVGFAVRKGLSPFALTYSAFALALVAAALYGLNGFSAFLVPLAGTVYLVSAFLDAIDGEVARRQGRASERGAFLDSVLDKASEVAVSVGLAFAVEPLAAILFASGSLLVSYARARAEALGVELAGVGIAERAERTIILFVGSLMRPVLGAEALLAALLLAALLSFLTVAQRVLVTVRRLSASSPP